MNIRKPTAWRRDVSILPASGVLPALTLRVLSQLPLGEQARFSKAWKLLASGNLVSLAREGDMALSGAGVCEALLARSYEARYHDPRQMVRLAEAARDVAEGLRTEELGGDVRDLVQAHTWGELGNAYRVADRPAEADEAFLDAFQLMPLSDLYLAAHLLQLRAALYGSVGDSEEAAELLATVADVYAYLGEPHLQGQAQIAQSIHASRAGRKDEALRLNEAGLARIDHGQDPGLAMAGLHNRLLLLLDLGRKEEARRTLVRSRAFGGDGPVFLRLRWMEGRALRELDELELAEEALRQARDGLSALGLKRYAAEAALDLSATLLRQKREFDAQLEGLYAEKLLLQLDLGPRVYGVLMVLDAAFRSGAATAELVEKATGLLRLQENERASLKIQDRSQSRPPNG